MVEIIEWLKKIEHLAFELYSKASHEFREDKNLYTFLKRSSEDETFHYHIMTSASVHIKDLNMDPVIILDQTLKNKIERPFIDNLKRLKKGRLKKRDLLEGIAKTELSEWNDVFIYVVKTLSEHIGEFKSAASRIQNHKRAIELFFESLPDGKEIIGSVKNLEPIWNENILIVEDNKIIADLLVAILNKEGNIDCAYNGQAALELLDKKYYKLIISDMNMPVMDGIEFLKRAQVKIPGINEKFLFYTGLCSSDTYNFFRENKISYMLKPSSVQDIRKNALDILLKATGSKTA